MATIITVKDETTVRQLADRLYGTLDARDRTLAEAALLKANPHLADREAFRAGAVVTVPPVRGLTAQPAATRNDPVGDVRDAIGVAVDDYRKHLAASLAAAAADLGSQEELLKDKEVAAALKRAGGTELAKPLAESLQARAKVLAEERKRQDGLFKRIAADLKGLDAG
jgi:phage tail protein X